MSKKVVNYSTANISTVKQNSGSIMIYGCFFSSRDQKACQDCLCTSSKEHFRNFRFGQKFILIKLLIWNTGNNQDNTPPINKPWMFYIACRYDWVCDCMCVHGAFPLGPNVPEIISGSCASLTRIKHVPKMKLAVVVRLGFEVYWLTHEQSVTTAVNKISNKLLHKQIPESLILITLI